MTSSTPTPYAPTAFVGPRIPPRRIRGVAALGPAFVAAIAYVDPGNFATNFAAGAGTGYRLVWVVLAANLIAIPIQYLSAKLGIVTGRSLPRLCADTMPRPAARLMWAQAELVAMATDLAEFIGAAVGLYLLFGVPMPAAAAITAVLAYGVLALQRRGHRPFEVAIAALLFLIGAGFLYMTLSIGPSVGDGLHGLIPSADPDILLLAVGIIGATVMPHAIYLHSGLMSSRTVGRNPAERTRLLRLERVDIGIAMTIAGFVNLSMLAVAATLYKGGPPTAEITLDSVHRSLGETVGGGAALAFAAALLASGISSSSVGTAAGQTIMDGFLRRRVPLWLRRAVTMAPAVVLLCTGVDPTRALVLSQVVLSFGIPFALIALLVLTSRRTLMGEHVNSTFMKIAMTAVVVVISSLNVLLLVQQFSG